MRRDILYRHKTLQTCHLDKEYPSKLRLKLEPLRLLHARRNCSALQGFQDKCTPTNKWRGKSAWKQETFLWPKEKISPEQEALILGSTEELRDQEGSFSSGRLMERTGIHHVSDQTVSRLQNRNDYFFLQAHKKGLMSQSDKDKRVTFARRMQADYPLRVWKDSIAFYLDGVLLIYKANPMD